MLCLYFVLRPMFWLIHLLFSFFNDLFLIWVLKYSIVKDSSADLGVYFKIVHNQDCLH